MDSANACTGGEQVPQPLVEPASAAEAFESAVQSLTVRPRAVKAPEPPMTDSSQCRGSCLMVRAGLVASDSVDREAKLTATEQTNSEHPAYCDPPAAEEPMAEMKAKGIRSRAPSQHAPSESLDLDLHL